MMVRRETCEGRPLPAYKVAQVPKKLMSGGGGGGGGDSDTFFFNLKILVSILQAHIRGTLRTPQTSYKHQKKKKKKKAWDISISAWDWGEMRENAWVSRSMRESWQLW